MSLVWSRAPYSSSTLLVLLALADWANEDGICWPSIQTLSKKARVERRSTQYIIRKLAADGIIEIEEGRGRGHQHKYQIKVHKLRPLQELKGASSDMEKVQSDAQKVQPIAHDPLVEPLIDTSARRGAKEIKNMSREEFLSYLGSKPEYAHIDIKREISKANTWIENHDGRKLTKRFLINWLNNIEVPLNGHGKNGSKVTTTADLKRMLGENDDW